MAVMLAAVRICKSLGFLFTSEFILQILAKFLGDTKQLFSESIDKLNLKSVGSLLFSILFF